MLMLNVCSTYFVNQFVFMSTMSLPGDVNMSMVTGAAFVAAAFVWVLACPPRLPTITLSAVHSANALVFIRVDLPNHMHLVCSVSRNRVPGRSVSYNLPPHLPASASFTSRGQRCPQDTALLFQ